MTKREEYGISFRRKKAALVGNYNFTETAILENEQIAMHIENSSRMTTESQIEALRKALNNEQIQEDWGEVMGSQLDIYVQRGTVLGKMSDGVDCIIYMKGFNIESAYPSIK